MRVSVVCSWILLGTVVGAGCATTSDAMTADEALAVEVRSLVPEATALTETRLRVVLAVRNLSRRSVQLDRIEHTIRPEDTALTGVEQQTTMLETALGAGESAELAFEQDVDLSAAPDLSALLAKEAIPAELEGLLWAEGKKIPFRQGTSLDLPRVPEVELHDAQAAHYDGEGVTLTFFLRLHNRNAFPIDVGSVRYALSVNSAELRSDTTAVGARLIAQAAEEYEVSVILPADAQKKTALEIPYRVEGAVEAGGLRSPFEHQGALKIADPSGRG